MHMKMNTDEKAGQTRLLIRFRANSLTHPNSELAGQTRLLIRHISMYAIFSHRPSTYQRRHSLCFQISINDILVVFAVSSLLIT